MKYLISVSFLVFADVDQNKEVLPEEAIHAEQLALQARRKIKTGSMKIKASYWTWRQSDPLISEYEVKFDGRKFRIDSFRNHESESNQNPSYNKYVFTPDYFIHYTPDVSQDGRSVAVRYLKNTDAPPGQVDNRRMNIYDPRCIGIVPYNLSVIHAFTLEEILGRPDRVKSSIAETEYKGSQTWQVEYERKDGIIVRLWIVPSMDYSVVRVEQDNVAIDGEFTDTVESTMQHIINKNIWYPKKVIYQRNRTSGEHAGETLEKEILEIDHIDLNSEIDEASFTMASMEIPSDSSIFEYPPHPEGSRTWDGKNITTNKRKMEDIEKPSKTSPAENNRKWFFISINLAVVAAVLLIYLFRRMKKIR